VGECELVTESVTCVLDVSEPLVPVTVSVEVPVLARVLVCTFSVEEPPAATGFGEKEALVEPGSPLTLSWTFPVKPLLGVTVTV
jgi:hypothetical protein